MPFSDTMPVIDQINVLLETNSGSIPITEVSIDDINVLTNSWSNISQARDFIAAAACCCSSIACCCCASAQQNSIRSRRIL